METLQLLGAALGLATLSGFNLYMTVFLTGLCLRMDWLHLSPHLAQLQILEHPVILAISGILFFLEFFADKIPWVDSTWDALHTVIRPVGGCLLGLQALGSSDPTVNIVAGLFLGGAALLTHGAKAGTRLVVNTSPEPFSNMALSAGENVLVAAGLALIAWNPTVSLVVASLFLASIMWYLPRIIRLGKAVLWLLWKKITAFSFRSRPTGHHYPVQLPHQSDMALHRLAAKDSATATIKFAIPCLTGSCRLLAPHLKGHLIAIEEAPDKLYFVSVRRFGKTSARLVLDPGYRVAHEGKMLSENLVIYQPHQRRPCWQIALPSPDAPLASHLAQLLSPVPSPSRPAAPAPALSLPGAVPA